MKQKLSPMQKRIIEIMKEKGPAAFTGEHARKHGFGVFEAKHGGVVIRAYQSPQWFLKQRGLIEVVERFIGESKLKVPGTWYKLTDKGMSC